MVQRICNHAAMMVLGIFVGVVIAAGLFGLGTQVQATATHGEGNFAIATGPARNDLEAFYFLDFLTGDLRAAVVNTRNGQFTSLFEHNINNDFESISKNPKFLMVTGLGQLPRARTGVQFGASLIYIAEASSGEVHAYALPFDTTLNAKGAIQKAGLIHVAGGSFRTTFVRDQ